MAISDKRRNMNKITLLLTDSEYKNLIENSERTYRTPGDYIRHLLWMDIKTKNPSIRPKTFMIDIRVSDTDGDLQLIGDIRLIDQMKYIINLGDIDGDLVAQSPEQDSPIGKQVV